MLVKQSKRPREESNLQVCACQAVCSPQEQTACKDDTLPIRQLGHLSSNAELSCGSRGIERQRSEPEPLDHPLRCPRISQEGMRDHGPADRKIFNEERAPRDNDVASDREHSSGPMLLYVVKRNKTNGRRGVPKHMSILGGPSTFSAKRHLDP